MSNQIVSYLVCCWFVESCRNAVFRSSCLWRSCTFEWYFTYLYSLWSLVFISVLWHCWSGDRMGFWTVKMLDLGLLVVTIWLKHCTSYSSSCHHSPPPSILAPVKSRMETFQSVVKVVLWSRGLTWRSQVGANPIPIPTPLIWRYLGIK